MRGTAVRERIIVAAVAGLCAAVLLAPVPSAAQLPDASASDPGSQSLVLSTGDMHTLQFTDLERVAIGDPEIVDVTVISQSEVLIRAKNPGSTGFMVWDASGKQHTRIDVVDPTPANIAKQFPEMLEQLGLSHITVAVRAGRAFLIGEATEEQFMILEQMTATYGDTFINLVRITEADITAKPDPLVKLSVQVVEINRKDVEQLGISWTSNLTLTEPSLTDLSPSEALTRFGTGVTRTGLSMAINALVTANKARILSEPTLVTSSGKPASSFIGVEVPVIKNASLQSGELVFSVEFRETGVLLEITPTVLTEDEFGITRITTELETEVSDIDTASGLNLAIGGSSSVLVPGFKVRNTSTEVTIASGETIVIAGLLELDDTDTMSKVPGLASLPIFGRLFRNPSHTAEQRELVITVTPEVIKNGDKREALEQAREEPPLAVAEVTPSVEDPRLEYALQVQERIATAIVYPQADRDAGIEGSVKIRLHLFADGSLGRATILESSGSGALDAEAIQATERQSPFPAFPEAFTEGELWLDIPVIFSR